MRYTIRRHMINGIVKILGTCCNKSRARKKIKEDATFRLDRGAPYSVYSLTFKDKGRVREQYTNKGDYWSFKKDKRGTSPLSSISKQMD